MGAWDYKPLDNDEAQDLLAEFNDAKNISILEKALNEICVLKEQDCIEAPESERAVAAACVIQGLAEGVINQDKKEELLAKVKSALKRILEKSELKDLWSESDEYKEWITSVQKLIPAE